MRRLVVIAIVLVMFVGCGSKSKEELYSGGLQEVSKGNSSGAIILFKNALEKDQTFEDARYQLALAYAKVGKLEQAEKELQKVLRQNPGRKGLNLELAKVCIGLKKPKEALQAVQAFQAKEGETADSLEVLGSVYVLNNDLREAERCFRAALAKEPSRVSTQLGLARLAISQGRENEGRQILSDLIASSPNDTASYYLLAALEGAKGNRDQALALYEKIATIDQADPRARYKAGVIILEKGDVSGAAKRATALVEKFPKQGEGYRLRGLVSLQQKKYAEAITDLQQAVKLQPNLEGIYFLGMSQYGKGELESALSQFRRILDVTPNFTKARLLTGMILLKQKRVDDAIAECSKILKVDPNNALAHNLLGSAYMAKGMYDEGMAELKRATQLDPKIVEAHVKKGLYNLASGKTDEAELDLRSAIQVAPDILNTRLLLASHYLHADKKSQAYNLLREGLKGQAADAPLYNAMSRIRFAEGRQAEGVDLLTRAKSADPGFYPTYYTLAAYKLVKGDHAGALAEYAAVLARDPKNVKALLGTAAVHDLKNRSADAMAWYEKARDTGSPAGALALAGFLAKQQKVGKAIKVVSEALKSQPRDVTLLEFKGKLQVADKAYSDALQTFSDMEEVAPEQAIQLKVRTHMAAKDSSRAMEQAQRIVALKPNAAYGYLILASVHESTGAIDRALAEVKNALRKEPGNIQGSMMLGNLYLRKNDQRQALAAFEELTRRNPDSAPGYFQQGVVLEAGGKKTDAAKRYRMALSKDEAYVPALNNLAFICADDPGTRAESLRLALSAYNHEPSNPAILDTYGYALLRNGRAAEARPVLEKASSLLQKNPSVLYHLALAYRDTGDLARANSTLTASLKLGAFPEAQLARAALNGLAPKTPGRR